MIFELAALIGALIYPAGAVVATKIANDAGPAGQQPGYTPAPGYPPIQYAQQQYQPEVYGSVRRVTSAQEIIPRNGRYMIAHASIYGRQIPMIVDTGATVCVLSHEDARRLTFNLSRLNYRQRIVTSSGVEMASGFDIPEISVGRITLHNVAAIVFQRDCEPNSILGMSFMDQLSSVQLTPNALVLTQ